MKRVAVRNTIIPLLKLLRMESDVQATIAKPLRIICLIMNAVSFCELQLRIGCLIKMNVSWSFLYIIDFSFGIFAVLSACNFET